MAQYQIEIRRTAIKELAELSPDLGRRILEAIESLAPNPRPRQCRKLKGSENCYRLRIGAYRVLYQIDDKAKVVIVSAVGHRREVY